MKRPDEMTKEELKNEILQLRDNKDQESVSRVELLRKELNQRYLIEGDTVQEYNEDEDEGSFFAGLLLGFILSFLGVIFAFAFGKRKVRTASIIGCFIAIIVGSIIAIVILSQRR